VIKTFQFRTIDQHNSSARVR